MTTPYDPTKNYCNTLQFNEVPLSTKQQVDKQQKPKKSDQPAGQPKESNLGGRKLSCELPSGAEIVETCSKPTFSLMSGLRKFFTPAKPSPATPSPAAPPSKPAVKASTPAVELPKIDVPFKARISQKK